MDASPLRNPATSATNNDTSVDESRELEKQCVIIICEKEVNKCRHLRTTTTAMTRVLKVTVISLEILDEHRFTVTVAELAQEISVLKKCHHVFLTICIAKSFSSFGKNVQFARNLLQCPILFELQVTKCKRILANHNRKFFGLSIH